MLKRATKVTSLLVTAASIVSMVPVMAADVQKVDTKEGTVYSGKAIGDGVFFINGELNDEDAVYYVTNDGKYTKVDGLDSGDTVGDELFDKYLEIDNDKYIDEKNGYKIVDEKIRENIVDDAATAIRKKIKNDNDGRFDEDYYQAVVSASPKRYGETSTFLDGFSGKWSHYQYKLKTSLTGESTSYSTIYSDLDGNYVDGNYNLGDLKINTTGGSAVIKNTKDTYEVEDKANSKTYEIKAKITENTFLSEAYGDLYRTADLTIYGRVKGSGTPYAPITNEVEFGGNNKHKITNGNSVTVLQRFSKEQASDDVDGIKYPKSSTIYFITDEDGKYEPVLGLQDADRAGSGITGTGYGIFTTSAKGITSFYQDFANSTVYAETVKLKNQNGYNYVDLSDIDDTKFQQTAIVGGDLWTLSDGYIKAWDGNESFEKVYKVDGSMNKFSMDSKDNIITWNEDDKVYSIINNKSKSDNTVTTTGNNAQVAATTESAVQTGWIKNNDGTWSYTKTDGTKAIGWYKDNANTWYYSNDKGIMVSNTWIQGATGEWYYLGNSGAMQTGWINDKGTWYYCNTSGVMLANTTVDGYILGTNGAWAK